MSQRIPTGLSPGMTREFTSALDRTGWTEALEVAAERIAGIVSMAPEEFEVRFKEHYQRSN